MRVYLGVATAGDCRIVSRSPGDNDQYLIISLVYNVYIYIYIIYVRAQDVPTYVYNYSFIYVGIIRYYAVISTRYIVIIFATYI